MSLIDALQQATADDLAEIDKRIEAIRNELDSLLEVRKVLNVRINGRTPRASPKPRQKESDDEPGGDLAKAMFALLRTHGTLPTFRRRHSAWPSSPVAVHGLFTTRIVVRCASPKFLTSAVFYAAHSIDRRNHPDIMPPTERGKLGRVPDNRQKLI